MFFSSPPAKKKKVFFLFTQENVLSQDCLLPDMYQFENKTKECIFKTINFQYVYSLHKQTELEFARNIKVNLNCKSDLIKMAFQRAINKQCVSW